MISITVVYIFSHFIVNITNGCQNTYKFGGNKVYGRNTMSGKTIFEYELESLAAELIGRYPTGFLSEIKVDWPCAITIQVLKEGCLDTPVGISATAEAI